MATTQITTRGGSVTFPSLLTILFVALKLTGQIDWSWWWVLSPLWICASVAIVFALVVTLVVTAMFVAKRID